MDKFHLPVTNEHTGQSVARQESPIPLRAVYLLRWGEPEIVRLKGLNALYALVQAATYRGELLEPMGLTAAQARTLTLNTFIGAAKLAAASDEPLSVLRERVTSKGGTTAAALSVMAERGLPAAIEAALEAARDRSAQMGEEFGRAR